MGRIFATAALLPISVFFAVNALADSVTLAETLRNFQRQVVPAFVLDLTEIYGRAGQFAVLHPVFDVRRLVDAPRFNACGSAPEASDTLCRRPLPEFLPTPSDEKKSAILGLLNEGRPVPEDFALRAPFTAANGESYAALLVREGAEPFASRPWVETHLSFFRASELKEILALFGIHQARFEAIAGLSGEEVRLLVEGAPVLLSADYLFVRDQSRLGFSPLLYRVYPAGALRSFLAGSDHDVTAGDAYCLERSGNACFTYSPRTALAKLWRYSFLIAAVVVFFAALAALTALRALRERRRESRRRRQSLQILSHEFRTPVASLLLLLDRLSREGAAALPVEAQDLLTGASAEAFRLQRILETSKSYLGATGPRLELTLIPDLNDWLREVALEVDPRVRCELLPATESARADLFWLRLAVSNLLRNAFAHGAEPVVLRATKKRGRVRITVEDGGDCQFPSLDAMAEPFVKGATSEGLGLGLNITRFIVREWGSRLEFARGPTSFSFTLGERRWPGF